MGLFNRNKDNKINEKTYEENGYIIGVDSHIIYHVPKETENGTYILPSSAMGIKDTAINEMRQAYPNKIIIPGSFKKFTVELINFQNLSLIDLQEGIEEVKYTVTNNKYAVNTNLPSTIKKIGRNNYPVVQDLVIPNGAIELDTLFASHDTYLKSIDIPGSVKTIPAGAFNQCKNLNKVVLHEGVETSLDNAFRGTNSLQELILPSTYNGKITLSMDPRPSSNKRGNSKYDSKQFKDDENRILNIKIKRDNKKFEFNIRRGEQPIIDVNQNKITISSGQQIISIDCQQLEQGIYNIENGKLVPIKKQESKDNDVVSKNIYNEDIKKDNDNLKRNVINEIITIIEFINKENSLKKENSYLWYHTEMVNKALDLFNEYISTLGYKGSNTQSEIITYISSLNFTTEQRKKLKSLKRNPIYKKILCEKSLTGKKELERILGDKLTIEGIILDDRLTIKSEIELESEFETNSNKLAILLSKKQITDKQYYLYLHNLENIYNYYISQSKGEQLSLRKITDNEINNIKRNAIENGISFEEQLAKTNEKNLSYFKNLQEEIKSSKKM